MKEEKKRLSTKETTRRMLVGLSLLAFLVSGILYLALLHIEKEAVATEPIDQVWVLKQEWSKGMNLEETKLQESLELCEVPKKLIPVDAFLATQAVPTGRVTATYSAGTIVTQNMIENVDTAARRLKEPTVVAVEAADYLSAAGGILAEGDQVDLFFWKDSELLGTYKGLTVACVMDAGGNVQNGAEEKTMVRFTVYLERDQVQQFYGFQQEGKVRAAKLVWKK